MSSAAGSRPGHAEMTEVSGQLYDALFAPRAVALVGASDVRGKPTSRPLEFLRQHGWPCEVYPVNPRRSTVLGEHAWPSLADLPAVPDHALILTPADAAVAAVRDCAELGVPVATVVADGFLASTPDGARRREQLLEIVAGSTLRLLGPSSLGVANPVRAMALTGNAAFAETALPAGDVFVASQSGSALGALLSRGAEMGLGFAAMVSTGNEFDLSLGEICLAAADGGTARAGRGGGDHRWRRRDGRRLPGRRRRGRHGAGERHARAPGRPRHRRSGRPHRPHAGRN